jgi:antirestriction protein ArdC
VPTTTSERTDAKSKFQVSDWIVGMLFAAAALAAVGLSIAKGPQYQAAAEAAIDLENMTACAGLGIAPESSRYGACVAALAGVRASSARRNEQSIP